MTPNKIIYEVRITFEDGTRVNFNGEGITEFIPGTEGTIRLRHNKLVTDLNTVFKNYINRT